MTRAVVLALLLAFSHAAASAGSWATSAVDLPATARSAAAAAAAIARDAPARHLEAARADAPSVHDAPHVEAGVDGSWTVDWAGRHGASASARGTLRWLDPARAREAGEARLRLRALELDADLEREEVATSAVRTSVLAWRAEHRLRLVRLARVLPAPRDSDLREQRARMLADAPLIELAAERSARALARATGRPPDASPPVEAWDRFALRPVEACPDGDVSLVLARQNARLVRERAHLHAVSAASPSLSVSLAADVGVPDLSEPSLDVGARLALSVGAPAAWPLSGTLRAESDAWDTTVSVEARHRPRSAPRSWDLEIAAADAAAAEARDRAVDLTWLDHAEWRRAAEHLRELGPPPGPPATFAAVRGAWERLDLVTRAADLRSRLALSCAIEKAVSPPVAP